MKREKAKSKKQTWAKVRERDTRGQKCEGNGKQENSR